MVMVVIEVSYFLSQSSYPARFLIRSRRHFRELNLSWEGDNDGTSFNDQCCRSKSRIGKHPCSSSLKSDFLQFMYIRAIKASFFLLPNNSHIFLQYGNDSCEYRTALVQVFPSLSLFLLHSAFSAASCFCFTRL